MEELNTFFNIDLIDQEGNPHSFTAGFRDGEFFEEGDSADGVTDRAEFTLDGALGYTLAINGDGWRDIDAGDYLEDFIRDVLLGDEDADEFLTNISEALQIDGEPGCTVE